VDWTHREMLLGRASRRAAALAAPSIVSQGPLFRSIHSAGRVHDTAQPNSHVPFILKPLAVAAGLEVNAVAGL
jgi:hypothetical protein